MQWFQFENVKDIFWYFDICIDHTCRVWPIKPEFFYIIEKFNKYEKCIWPLYAAQPFVL